MSNIRGTKCRHRGRRPNLNNTLNHLLDLSLVHTVEMSHYASLMYRIVGNVHRYKYIPARPLEKKLSFSHANATPPYSDALFCSTAV